MITLKDAAEAYVRHLEAIGQKASTVMTARRTLDLFANFAKPERDVASLTVEDLVGFNLSAPATTLRGRPRARLSVQQIRRIVAAALAWWNQQGWAPALDLPEKGDRP